MAKILGYSELTTPAAGDLIFIGDISSSALNPEIKYISHDNFFKRLNMQALNVSGLSLYDDGGNLGIFIQDGGNVGIGESSPDSSLHVSKAGANSIIKIEAGSDGFDAYIDFIQNSSSKFHVGFDDTGNKFLMTRDIAVNTDIVINTDGNVGIGTTSNSATLNVDGDINVQATNDLILDANNSEIRVDGTKLKINEYGGGTSGVPQTNDVEIYGQGGSSPLFFADTSAGNVGIGINGPLAKLHVKGTAANLLTIEQSGGSADPYLKILGSNGNASAVAFLVNTSTTIGIGGSATLGTASLNIQRSDGAVHLGGDGSSFPARFAVTSSDTILSQLNSESTSGSVLTLRNTSAVANIPTIAIVYSNKNTTQKVNWIGGNFYNSASYFGIHYRNDNLSASNASFDATLTNNLLYLDTSGNLNIKGNYKSNSNSGHNTGRFVQCFSARFFIADTDSESVFLTGGFGNAEGNASGTIVAGVNSSVGTSSIPSIGNPAPFGGKLINVKIYGSDITENSLGNQVRFLFKAIAPASVSSPVQLTTLNSAYATASVNDLSIITVKSFDVGNFSNSGELVFLENDILFIGLQRLNNSGHESLVANVVLTYEFAVD